MLGQVNHLLQFALAKGALGVQLMSDFGGEQSAGGFLIRGNGSLLLIFGKSSLDQCTGKQLLRLASLG
ncbi:hypothetical protein D3C77_437610 [compost metagenome]